MSRYTLEKLRAEAEHDPLGEETSFQSASFYIILIISLVYDLSLIYAVT